MGYSASSIANGLYQTFNDKGDAEPGVILNKLPGMEESEDDEEYG